MDKSGIFFCGISVGGVYSHPYLSRGSFPAVTWCQGVPQPMTPACTAEQTNPIRGGYLQLLTKLSISLVSSSRQCATGPQLYCQKFIRAQEWENVVFRFVIGEAKQGRDVFGGFFPQPQVFVYFYSHRMRSYDSAGCVQSLPLPSVLLLSRASPQCRQQQGKCPERTELHLVPEAGCGPRLLQSFHWAP